jgi:hypothetical protein
MIVEQEHADPSATVQLVVHRACSCLGRDWAADAADPGLRVFAVLIGGIDL